MRKAILISLLLAVSVRNSLQEDNASSQFDCNFDSGFCGWTQDSTDSFDWILKYGTTPSSNTGPSSDHTTGSGQYAYIEASDPRVNGDIARLTSPYNQVVAGGTKCLRFYYHMYGTSMGTFNIYVSKAGDPLGSPIFQKSGNRGNNWIIGQVDITRGDIEPFKVTFEGIVGSSYTGDLAIDDVTISSGYCAQAVTDECDFEDPNICGYSQETGSDNFDWIRKSANTPSLGTGPPNDHTLGTSAGYYMYIETSSEDRGEEARLWSPTYPAAGGHCIEFYYHMYGSTIETLNVYIVETGEDVLQLLPSWSQSSNQGDKWYIARFLAPTVYNYRVVFEGVAGSSFTSDIAIDDVRITSESCLSQAIPNSAIPQTTFPPPQTTAQDTVTSAITRHISPAGTTIAPGAYVSCGSMSMTAILDRTLLENNGDARDVHFEDQSCTGYDISGSQIAVTTRYDECNTQSEQTDAVIKYSNVVTYFKSTSENGSQITRDFGLKIPVICELNRRGLLGNNFKPKVGIVSFSELGYGSFSLNLGRYTDEHFTAPPSDLDALVHLGQKLYFGVKLNASTDLTLLIDRCWATPDVYPTNPIKYTFIKDGCGLDSTVEFHEEDASLKGFSIDAFTFIGEYHEVFLHCDIFVCEDNDPSSRCSQGCVSRARRAAGEARGSSSQPHTISNGPMSSQHARSIDTSWLANPVNMMLVAAAGLFFITMVAMVTVRELRSRGKPSNRLEAENENEA